MSASEYFPALSVLRTGFEGCEKRLLVHFEGFGDKAEPGDIRRIDRNHWSQILEHAKCTILNVIDNEVVVAYLLSESSLFVYKDKIMIKTCGTTTLLNCLPVILETVDKECGMSLVHLSFSRSNFMFPHAQPKPHRHFDMEVGHLNAHGFVGGSAIVLGPLDDARFYVYRAGVAPSNEQSLEIVMFDLDPDVMQQFYRENATCDRSVTETAGIKQLLHPDAVFDEYMFDPCGYSLNAIHEQTYWTIHVTPEKDFSFVSFETNVVPGEVVGTYQEITKSVVNLFRPRRFSVALFAGDGNEEMNMLSWKFEGRYCRQNHSFHKYDAGHHIASTNWESAEVAEALQRSHSSPIGGLRRRLSSHVLKQDSDSCEARGTMAAMFQLTCEALEYLENLKDTADEAQKGAVSDAVGKLRRRLFDICSARDAPNFL